MENNYFIFTDKSQRTELERFHICSWEFINGSALIEFGGEIVNSEIFKNDTLKVNIYIPWITSKHKINDLYNSLKEPENCKFIFNDSVSGNKFLDDGNRKEGVIQEFIERKPLCIIPIRCTISEEDKIVSISINLKSYKSTPYKEPTNLYFRFYIEPDIHNLSTRKSGISRSTIIYDVKINEKRNLPDYTNFDLKESQLCKINSCFYFNILPNSYDLTFFDAGALKNIRTLEYDSFKKYIGDNRVKRDELVVVFNKKENREGYGFFSVFARERIGAGQFALAVIVNLFSGILLFIPSFRKTNSVDIFTHDFWIKLPLEVYASIFIGITIIVYFFWPKIMILINRLVNLVTHK